MYMGDLRVVALKKKDVHNLLDKIHSDSFFSDTSHSSVSRCLSGITYSNSCSSTRKKICHMSSTEESSSPMFEMESRSPIQRFECSRSNLVPSGSGMTPPNNTGILTLWFLCCYRRYWCSYCLLIYLLTSIVHHFNAVRRWGFLSLTSLQIQNQYLWTRGKHHMQKAP